MSVSLPAVLRDGVYNQRLHPVSCSIARSLNPLSTVNMEIPQDDDIANLDWVKVDSPDGVTEYYRVSSISVNADDGIKSIYMEHGACLLDDIVITQKAARKSANFSMKDTITNILAFLLGKQSKWIVGTVESTDTIYIELTGLTLMTAIVTMMESIPDYQVEFVQASESDWHVDIRHRPTDVYCEGRLSRNLKTCEVRYDAGSICTRLHWERNNVVQTLDSDNIAVYGVHEESTGINDSLSAAQQQRIAQAYLDARDHPVVGVTISGIELSQITGLPIDEFKLGKICRIAIPWLGITENEVITEKRYSDPYVDPEMVSITLANAKPDLSIAIAAVTGGGGGGSKNSTKKQLDKYKTQIDQDSKYIRLLATETEYDALENGTVTAYGQVVLNSRNIQLVTSKTGIDGLEPGETLLGQIDVTAGKVSAIVENIGADGAVTAASIALAINAEGSSAEINADRIVLSGSGGSKVTLDDKVSVLGELSISQGGLEIENSTYITDGSLHVSGGLEIGWPNMAATIDDDGTFNGGDVYCSGLYIGGEEVTGVIVDASVSGNTLTLTRLDGTTVNFSKAATATVSGSWSGGVFTVNATDGEISPSPLVTSLTDTGHWGQATGITTETATTYYGEIKATIGSSQTILSTGKTYEVPVAGKLQEKTAYPTQNTQTVLPDSGKIGLSKVTVRPINVARVIHKQSTYASNLSVKISLGGSTWVSITSSAVSDYEWNQH